MASLAVASEHIKAMRWGRMKFSKFGKAFREFPSLGGYFSVVIFEVTSFVSNFFSNRQPTVGNLLFQAHPQVIRFGQLTWAMENQPCVHKKNSLEHRNLDCYVGLLEGSLLSNPPICGPNAKCGPSPFESHPLPLLFPTCRKWGANLGIEDGLVSPKTFLWFFAKKTMCHKGWWRPALIQKILGKSCPCICCILPLPSASEDHWKKTLEMLIAGLTGQRLPRHETQQDVKDIQKQLRWDIVQKNSLKSVCGVFVMHLLFWMYVLVLFLFVVCFPLSQLRNNPGETSFWVVQVTSSDASEGFVARCALST